MRTLSAIPRWDGVEPLGGGEISDSATVPVRADTLALVGDAFAEPVLQRLGLRGCDVIGRPATSVAADKCSAGPGGSGS